MTILIRWLSKSLGAFLFKSSRPSSRGSIALITMFSLASISWTISCVRLHQSITSLSSVHSSSKPGRVNWSVVLRPGRVSFSQFVLPKVVVLLSMSTSPLRSSGPRGLSSTPLCVCYVSVSLPCMYLPRNFFTNTYHRFPRGIGE